MTLEYLAFMADEDRILKRLGTNAAANIGCLMAFLILASIITLQVTGRIQFWAGWHMSLKIISTVMTTMLSVLVYFFIVVIIDTVMPKKEKKKSAHPKESGKD